MRSALTRKEPITLVTVLLLVGLTTAARAQDFWNPRLTPGRHVTPARAPGEVFWSATVESRYSETEQEAKNDALEKAQAKLISFLRSQDPPVEWTPTLDFVKKMVKAEGYKDMDGNARREFEAKVGPGAMMQALLRLEMTNRDHDEILRKDRDQRIEQRQILWLKVFGVLIGFLGLSAVYVRLDEWTRGYYTGMLRLAAAGGAAAIAAAAGLWFFHLI